MVFFFGGGGGFLFVSRLAPNQKKPAAKPIEEKSLEKPTAPWPRNLPSMSSWAAATCHASGLPKRRWTGDTGEVEAGGGSRVGRCKKMWVYWGVSGWKLVTLKLV